TASRLCDVAAEAHTRFASFVRYVCPSHSYYPALLPDERIPPGSKLRLHLAEEFGKALGTLADLETVKFTVPPRVRSRVIKRLVAVNRQGYPVIVVHTGPTWPVRDWPMERWCELVEKIAANGSVVIHVGTHFDSYLRRIPPRLIPNTINWTNALNLIELVALL